MAHEPWHLLRTEVRPLASGDARGRATGSRARRRRTRVAGPDLAPWIDAPGPAFADVRAGITRRNKRR
jgi:hypothetical protein